MSGWLIEEKIKKSLEVWEKTFREQELSGTVSDLQAFKLLFHDYLQCDDWEHVAYKEISTCSVDQTIAHV